jgi:predicted Zn finger-like uncharacterized protein
MAYRVDFSRLAASSSTPAHGDERIPELGMRFVCEQCQTRYTIPDEKARGRALKVRCKKCNGVIVIRPEVAAAEPAAVLEEDATAIASPEAVRKLQESLRASPTAPDAVESEAEPPAQTDSAEVEWYVIVNGVQQGPMDQKALVAQIGSGLLKNRHYVWSEQLPEWKRLEDVPELAVWLSEPTDHAMPVRSPTVRDRKAAAVPKAAASSPAIQDVFDDISLDRAERPAAAEVDPFSAVPDSPDIVKPEMGEMTRFVIAQSGIEQRKSPWRIAAFVGGALVLLAGLAFALSKVGVNLPLVNRIGSKNTGDKVYTDVGGDQSLRSKLLGSAPRQTPVRGSAPSPGTRVASREPAPLVHKEAQHVDQLDDKERERLKALYAHSGQDPSVKVARPTAAAAIDRPDAPLSAQQVSSTVARYQSGYGRCVDQELKRNPGFRGGKVRIVTTIMGSGLVRQAEIQSDDGALARRLNGSPLGGCLIDQTRRMVFPNFAGDPFDAEIPLVLGASM